jgi:hypothetical protein
VLLSCSTFDKQRLNSFVRSALSVNRDEAEILDVFKFLVSLGADLDSETLQLVCREGFVSVATYMLDALGPLSDDVLSLAICGACECNKAKASLTLVNMLLSRPGFTMNKNSLPRAFHAAACRNSHFECAKLLINAAGSFDCVQDYHVEQVLSYARDDPAEFIKFLLGGVSDPAKCVTSQTFFEVCEKGFLESLKVILPHCTPRCSRFSYNTPIRCVCSSSCPYRGDEMLRLLLQHGYAQSKDDLRNAFVIACRSTKVACVRALVEFGSLDWKELFRDASFVKATYSGVKCNNEHMEIMRILIELGMPLKFGRTMYSLRRVYTARNVELLDLLLTTVAGSTAPKIIIKELIDLWDSLGPKSLPKVIDILALLRAAGVDLDALLIKDCTKGHFSIVLRALVAAGANVNATKHGRRVVCYIAKFNPNTLLLRLMIQAGAEVEERELLAALRSCSKDRIQEILKGACY